VALMNPGADRSPGFTNQERFKMKKRINRREFISTGAAAGVAAASAGSLIGAASGNILSPAGQEIGGITQVNIFSKHLQWLDYKEMAVFARESGFNGIDLTVRPGGHVEPENVGRDLPEAVKAIKGEGLNVPMMTSAVNDPDLPLSRRVLETAAGQGIKFYRMGYYRYAQEKPVAETLLAVKGEMAKLARLNESIGIRGSYQNHSGDGYFGSSIWDLWHVLKDLSPEWTGSQFDLRHTMVESTLNWKTDLRLLADYVNTLAVKDSRWKNGNKGGILAENCPLGEGFVDFPEMFKILGKDSFNGPVSMHFEYPLGGAEHGGRELSISREYVKAAMKRDLTCFRGMIKN
jgi:sugar phosphate isomerase/epimerase